MWAEAWTATICKDHQHLESQCASMRALSGLLGCPQSRAPVLGSHLSKQAAKPLTGGWKLMICCGWECHPSENLAPPVGCVGPVEMRRQRSQIWRQSLRHAGVCVSLTESSSTHSRCRRDREADQHCLFVEPSSLSTPSPAGSNVSLG